MRTLCIALILFALAPLSAEARALRQVRDLVSTSVRSATSTHEISFTVTTAVPASGTIVLTPQAGSFSIPADLDATDVDIAVASGGPYTDADVAASASATEYGLSIVSGTSGSVTFTLPSGAGIAPGDQVRIRIGSNATYGGTGDTFITNPSANGSYTLRITTQSPASEPLDDGTTRITILSRVGVTSDILIIYPIRSNGLPSGTISHSNATIEISLNTELAATCRYATSTGVTYAAMTNSFIQTNSTLHTKVISGHVNNTSYTYYVRCINFLNNANLDDYEITFTLEDTPTIPVSTGLTGGGTVYNPGGGGQGTIPGGANTLYLASVMLSGFAPPNTSVKILKDGSVYSTVQVNALGTFQGTVTALERGTYSFAVYGTDALGRESSLYYTTLTVGVGTNNGLTNIILPPTVSLVEENVELGAEATLIGSSFPGARIEVTMIAQGSGGLGTGQSFTTTVPETSSNGAFTIPLKTTGLPAGTYLVRARAFYKGQESNYSRLTFLGVGAVVDPGFGIRADLNKDGKVNLVDFSIMLTSWNTPNALADINEDGRVGLADFSILLFNWTG